MKRIILIIIFIVNLFVYPAENERGKIVSSIFKSVEHWYGTVYKYGGAQKDGIDCSGLVVSVYKEVFNKEVPRSVNEQRKLGKPVISKFEPGDLLFFRINGTISHVGIYLFNNKFVHAASAGDRIGVVKSSLDEEYYKERFVFARRVITLPAYKKSE
jgi:probable lipoprotein NlpC